MKITLFLSFLLLIASCTSKTASTTYQLQLIDSNVQFGHRGISIDDASNYWLSGEHGSFVVSSDKGLTWTEDTLPGGQHFDFRDIAVISREEAFMISSGENKAIIVHTLDAGKSWSIVHTDTTPGCFFNGIGFFDELNGLAYGDQVNGQIDLLFTNNGGKTWSHNNAVKVPQALEGEAGFAASGTGLVIVNETTAFIAQGNASKTRILRTNDAGETWQALETPMCNGTGSGIYAMDFFNDQLGIVVGGNWEHINDTTDICYITKNGGQTWEKPIRSPYGYRSGVSFIDENTIVACGRNGVDISYDQGQHWKSISSEGFYAVDSDGQNIFLSGASGKLGQLIPSPKR